VHELSLALGILDIVAEEAERIGSVPSAVRVAMGPLAGVVREALLSAFELAREGSPFESTSLVIELTPMSAWCDRCDGERQVISIQDLRCVECGVPVTRLVTGQELHITGLEIPP
jgi:hydrogenase nickel incorporation protein HypA/HybF